MKKFSTSRGDVHMLTTRPVISSFLLQRKHCNRR